MEGKTGSSERMLKHFTLVDDLDDTVVGQDILVYDGGIIDYGNERMRMFSMVQKMRARKRAYQCSQCRYLV